MVKVYICDVTETASLEGFSSYRLSKLEKNKNEKHYAESVSAEMLLMYAAKKEGLPLPLDIKTDIGGKPYAENINFSISHSSGKILVAVSDSVIGADIQKINPLQNLEVAKKFLTESERENINTETFFKLFTMKESYFKMTGEGLPLSPKPFSEFEKCFFDTFIIEDYAVSVCSMKPFETTVEHMNF